MATRDFDVVIIGGSFGGIAAALAAAKEGNVKVALLGSSQWIGGQATSQGVSRWDEASIEYLETTCSSVAYRELRHQIRAWYRANTKLSSFGEAQPHLNPGFAATNYPLSVDPSVTHTVLTQMVEAASQSLTLFLGTKVVSVQIAGNHVTSVTTSTGEIFTGQTFLDATDVGELLPLANLKWTIGAEAHADTQEPSAPAQAHPEWIQPITVPIAIEARPDGEHHVINKPDDFENIVRKQRFHVDDGDINGVLHPRPPAGQESVFGYRQYIDSRNFAGPAFAYNRTTLNVGSNDYMDAAMPSGDASKDQAVYEGAKAVSRAFLFWLQTEVPRDDGSGNGYPNLRVRNDAFGTADGCAPQPYIRESRRIDALERIVQQDIAKGSFASGTLRAKLYESSCGIGWYPIDIHLATGYGTPWVGFETLRFQIPLGALLPKQLDNFVASCKNIGATHLTSGAYRVHPVEWAIGEAAGVLAAFSVRQKVTPRDVYNAEDRRTTYQYRLLARGIPLYWWSDVAFEDDPKVFAAAHLCALKGVFSGGQGGLGFDPTGSADGNVQKAIDANLGTSLPWPQNPMTRAEAAVFVCEQMQWPIE